MYEDEHESGLKRWSRLKRQAVVPGDNDPSQIARAPAEEAREESEADALQRLGLPDPDSLTARDDFSAYLRPDLPASLRQRALRVLWQVNPELARLDGLLDYDDDYSDAATVPDKLRTAWEIGRGFAGRDRAKGPPSADQPQGVELATTPEAALASTEAVQEEIDAPPDTNSQEEEAEDQDIAPPLPHRMRFTLPDGSIK